MKDEFKRDVNEHYECNLCFKTLCNKIPQKLTKHKEDFQRMRSKQGIHSLLHQVIMERRHFKELAM